MRPPTCLVLSLLSLCIGLTSCQQGGRFFFPETPLQPQPQPRFIPFQQTADDQQFQAGFFHQQPPPPPQPPQQPFSPFRSAAPDYHGDFIQSQQQQIGQSQGLRQQQPQQQQQSELSPFQRVPQFQQFQQQFPATAPQQFSPFAFQSAAPPSAPAAPRPQVTPVQSRLQPSQSGGQPSGPTSFVQPFTPTTIRPPAGTLGALRGRRPTPLAETTGLGATGPQRFLDQGRPEGDLRLRHLRAPAAGP
ncbi:gamma-gliadin-like [Thrips palmi]|uniref:Gamma-gliadin-like n=1 Tax=Thrips palmi TaxID=161013 RepID=A0A6P8YD05_THRPL|nr:gamma-gliadin-like [Thrips palmi]